MRKLLLYGIGIILLMVFWTWLSSPMIVTVNGTGEVSVSATSATVVFSLVQTEPQPEAAISAVKAKSANIRSLLKSQGVSDADITESQVTTYPASALAVGATGYQASITMSAKTARAPLLIPALYTNAALVTQPIISVDNQPELEAKAFDLAIVKAKTAANTIANKNLKFIRRIIAISSSTATDTTTGLFKLSTSVSVSYKMW